MKNPLLLWTLVAGVLPHWGDSSAAESATSTTSDVPRCVTSLVPSPSDRTSAMTVSARAIDSAPVDPSRIEAQANRSQCEFDVKAMDLRSALTAYSQQAAVDGVRVGHSFTAEVSESDAVLTPQLRGTFGVAEALRKLTQGSDFEPQFVGPTLVLLHRSKPMRPAPEYVPPPAPDRPVEVVVTGEAPTPKPELVSTADTPHQASLIDRTQIGLAAASSSAGDMVTRLLPTNLPRDTTQGVELGTRQFRLFGLGAADTQVLVDGRPAGPFFIAGARGQGDIDAIPRGDIEKIEVIGPAEAGIYGAGATAGVINIKLRKECSGLRFSGSYGNSIRADTPNHSVFVSDCMQAFDGRTQLTFSLGDSQESPLFSTNRDFVARGRDTILQNNPGYYRNSLIPPVGSQTNVRSATGSGLWGPGTPTFTTIPKGYDLSQGMEPLRQSAGRYNMDLPDTAQLGGNKAVLRNGPRTRYVRGGLIQRFSPRLLGHVDFTSTDVQVQNAMSVSESLGLTGLLVPQGAPGNPFVTSVYASVPALGGDGLLQTRLGSNSLATGLRFEPSEGWGLELEYSVFEREQSWSLQAGRSAGSAIASGQLDVFRDLSEQPLELEPFKSSLTASGLTSRTSAWSLRSNRVLRKLHSGDMKVDTLLEYRQDRFSGGTEYMRSAAGDAVSVSNLSSQMRDVISGRIGIHIPFGGKPLSTRTALQPDLARFEIHIAGRYDEYETNAAPARTSPASPAEVPRQVSQFSIINPTVGFEYRPAVGWSLRGGFSKAFVPPSGNQLAPPAPKRFPAGSFLDPRRGYEPTGSVDFLAGGNSALGPERSKSWSVGVAYQSPDRPFQGSVEFVEIVKTNNIAGLTDLATSDMALFEERFSSRVTRGAVRADDTHDIGPITAIDATDVNVTRARVRAITAGAGYGLQLGRLGQLNLLGRVTYQPEFSMQATAGSVLENRVAISAGAPLEIGAMTEAAFTRGHARFSWTTRYFGPYQASENVVMLQNQGWQDVPHQTYHDVGLRYELGMEAWAVQKLDVQLTVQNVLDKEPPFDAASLTYFSPFADPRGAVYWMSVTASF